MSFLISNKENFPPPPWGRIGGAGYFKCHPPLYPSHRGRGIFKGINKIILQALEEDAYKEDITTKLLVPKDKTSRAFIVIKEDAVLCGLDIVREIFQKIDKNLRFQTRFKDGQKVKKNTKVAFLQGKTHAILTAERTALNFLGHLSGIATNTYRFVQKIYPLKVKLLDTRKTTPGLRTLEKYAVRTGGGSNHRMNLKKAIFVKDNHKNYYKNFSILLRVIGHLRGRMRAPLEIEVDNLKEFRQVIELNPDIILLDNMSTQQLKNAVKIIKIEKLEKRPLLEASGGITLKNIRQVAQTGVDQISVGALTHTHQHINCSLEIDRP